MYISSVFIYILCGYISIYKLIKILDNLKVILE